MDKYIIVFCEGDHDIAFLTRILSVNGFFPYKKKVKEFVKPLNNLYIKNLSNKKIEDFEFKFQRPKRKVPYSVLIKDDTLVIFHNFDGDGNILNNGANSIISMYLSLNKENRRKIEKYEKLNYRFLYFLDADEEGVEKRLNNLKESLDLDELNHYEIINKNDYELGCYIFHDDENNDRYGKLEDVLLNLMKPNNKDIFENSESFISNNKSATEGNLQFKKQKSVISIAGQLQFSGSSNAVIIANSDYIKKDDILKNTHCRNIIKLFE